MLTSKDLMIGDWHAFRGHPYKCTASDIASISECEEKGAPTDISEIPLTAEILEKNGIEFSVGPGGLYQGAISGVNCHIEFNIIKYVHELQNALRLCGITKEIQI